MFQPSTNRVSVTSGQTGPSGSSNAQNITLYQSGGLDANGDGIPDIGDYALGIDPNSNVQIVSGMSNIAALESGLIGGTLSPIFTGVISSLDLSGAAEAVTLAGSTANARALTAYVATGSYGLAIADVSNYQKPVLLGQIQIAGGNAGDVAVDSNLNIAAVAANAGGLALIDVSNPQQPKLLETLAINASHVAVKEGIAYAAVGGSIDAIDMATGDILQKISVDPTHSIDSVAIDGNSLYALVNGGTAFHTVAKYTIGSTLTFDTSLTVTGHPTFGRMYMKVGGGYIYVGAADNNNSQQIPIRANIRLASWNRVRF